MSWTGIYKGLDPQRAGKIIIQTDRGDWGFFYNDKTITLPSVVGSQVTYEASKPEGKNYWKIDAIYAANGPMPSAGAQALTQPRPIPAPVSQEDRTITPWRIFACGCINNALGAGKDITWIDQVLDPWMKVYFLKNLTKLPVAQPHSHPQNYPPQDFPGDNVMEGPAKNENPFV